MFSTLQSSVRELIKNIIITTFEEIDNNFKNSAERKSRYYINKSNFIDDICINNIPRQSIHNWIKEWNIPEIVPTSVETPETLYVMADEKYIGAQNIEKDIMVKCFVAFEDAVNQIIMHNPKRKELIIKKLNYILNNYSAIKAMLELKIGSSMESHISHLIASFFAARPKGFSTKRIEQYLKLNDYKNNNINIFKLYMSSYKNKEVIKINEDATQNYAFDNFENGNIPILCNGLRTGTYNDLKALAH